MSSPPIDSTIRSFPCTQIARSHFFIVAVDTAGQSDYLHRLDAHLQDAHGAIVVFALDSESSWLSVEHEFMPRVRRAFGSAPENDFACPLVIVGTKLDLVRNQQRAVSFDDAQSYAEAEGAAYFEISAREDVGVSEAVIGAVRKVRDFRRRSAKTTPMLPGQKFLDEQQRIEKKFSGLEKIKKKAFGWMQRRSSKGKATMERPLSPSPASSGSHQRLGSQNGQQSSIHRSFHDSRPRASTIGHDHGVMQRAFSIPASELDFVDVELGKGGFGVVRKAIWLKTCPVAVKTINQLPEHTTDEEFDDFARELTLLAELRHPNVLSMLGYATKDSFLCLVTEFIPEGDLSGKMFGKAEIDGGKAIALAKSICSGLVFLHRQNVIHREYVKSVPCCSLLSNR
jgi:GTPase SAR1 family protein